MSYYEKVNSLYEFNMFPSYNLFILYGVSSLYPEVHAQFFILHVDIGYLSLFNNLLF